MPNGHFLEPMKLGPPGAELVLTQANWAHPTGSFRERMARVSVELDTVAGIGRSTVHAQYKPRFTVNFDAGSHRTRDAIRALAAIFDTQLAFVYADNWLIPSEYYRMEADGDYFIARDNPYFRLDVIYNELSLGEIVVQSEMHVFEERDLWGSPTRGTDYFDSYDRATRRVNLTTDFDEGDVLFFDYRFKGCTVGLRTPPDASSGRGFIDGTRAWAIQVPLEAV